MDSISLSSSLIPSTSSKNLSRFAPMADIWTPRGGEGVSSGSDLKREKELEKRSFMFVWICAN